MSSSTRAVHPANSLLFPLPRPRAQAGNTVPPDVPFNAAALQALQSASLDVTPTGKPPQSVSSRRLIKLSTSFSHCRGLPCLAHDVTVQGEH